MLGTIKLIDCKLIIEYKNNVLLNDFKISDYKNNIIDICSSQITSILENKLVGKQVEFIILSQTKKALILQ